MDPRAVRAGIGAATVGLLIGASLGTYGGWSAVFSLASTAFGFWIIAFVFSTALAYIYGYWFNDFLPGTTIVRGVVYGILVWILMLVLGGATSFFKEAAFAEPVGTTVFLALIVHVVWGAVLAILYEAR